MVLVIRKAFNFEEVPKPLQFSTHRTFGFGLTEVTLEEQTLTYIFAYPDIIHNRIRVVYKILSYPKEVIWYIDCTTDLEEALEELTSIVLGFLVAIKDNEITW